MKNNEEVKEFLSKLAETGKTVIVEGKKDEKALRGIGVRNICCLNAKPLFEVAEEIADNSRKVIILTDLDKEGRKLYGKLSSQMQQLGVEVDNYFREFMFRNTKVRQVEGLARLV